MNEKYKEINEILKNIETISLWKEEASKISRNVAEMVCNTNDSRLLEIEYKWCGYGTYKSKAYINEYHFGKELSHTLKQVFNNHITHSEEAKFNIDDWRDALIDYIFEIIY